MKDLAKSVQTLLSLASDRFTSNEVIDAVFTAHKKCFAFNPCELCTYLAEDEDYGQGGGFGAQFLLEALASNPSLTPKQQRKLLSTAYFYRPDDYALQDLLEILARNPNIADAIKIELLDPSLYESLESDELEQNYTTTSEFLDRMLLAFQANPRFTPREVNAFKEAAGEFIDSFLDRWT